MSSFSSKKNQDCIIGVWRRLNSIHICFSVLPVSLVQLLHPEQIHSQAKSMRGVEQRPENKIEQNSGALVKFPLNLENMYVYM